MILLLSSVFKNLTLFFNLQYCISSCFIIIHLYNIVFLMCCCLLYVLFLFGLNSWEKTERKNCSCDNDDRVNKQKNLQAKNKMYCVHIKCNLFLFLEFFLDFYSFFIHSLILVKFVHFLIYHFVIYHTLYIIRKWYIFLCTYWILNGFTLSYPDQLPIKFDSWIKKTKNNRTELKKIRVKLN